MDKQLHQHLTKARSDGMEEVERVSGDREADWQYRGIRFCNGFWGWFSFLRQLPRPTMEEVDETFRNAMAAQRLLLAKSLRTKKPGSWKELNRRLWRALRQFERAIADDPSETDVADVWARSEATRICGGVFNAYHGADLYEDPRGVELVALEIANVLDPP